MNASTAAAEEEEGTIASILLSLPDENDDDDAINPNYNYDSINSVDVQKSITAIKGSSSFETTVSPNSIALSPSILNNIQKSTQSKSKQRSSSSSSSSLSRKRCTTDAGVSISPPDLNNSINTIGGHDSRLLINYTDEDRRSFLSRRRCTAGHDSRVLIDYKDDDNNGNDRNENEDQNNDQQRGKTKIESTKNDNEQVQLQAKLLQRRNSKSDVQQERRSSSHRIVRFSRKVTVREIRSHHDYTPRQVKKCWYQEDEVDQIKLKCLRILKEQKQKQIQRREQQNIIKVDEDEDEEKESSTSRNNEEDEDEHSINNDIDRNFDGKEDYVDDEEEEIEEEQHEEYCLRGLESYEPIAYQRKKRLRNKAQQIVFDINDQSYGADYCDEMIAEYYSNTTANCSLVAHIIGLQDERDACAAYS
ncbi:hypothetical protein FRACYDRAFT_249564 [Fragilariopsis cylindrus CCMP1102]|uniref:Uncharacterized protein n=1 Tax=Fragilariopsis cylindrus CCMP1102 TaxID=635003 RepID=A0A1E7ES94_9STRA|nr:hypothetical protein FRACYDRAFT_249564 [Fragilariopsis cylindrus CCMP1102]|eukprot:OEU08664.1 hypothetical protein FRACYDRAFT_249564 [Fragilariopsis cylindrus CCMP1102]